MFRAAFVASVAVVALSVSTSTFAQATSGTTRAQVRAELAQLEKAGYNPQGPQENFPQDLMAAEQRVAASQDAAAYGGAPAGITAAGAQESGK